MFDIEGCMVAYPWIPIYSHWSMPNALMFLNFLCSSKPLKISYNRITHCTNKADDKSMGVVYFLQYEHK